ncbi:MAG: carboxypeptidase regulatory-like domain-containing protein [Sandaracinaceae bacterium]|nr:carboxypeptidase regulatory-like domain-containing protein [Sandaracinaceae bacterium]
MSLGAVALLGVPLPTDDGAAPTDYPSGTNTSPVGVTGPLIRLDLTPAEPLEGPVQIEALVDGEVAVQVRGPLPQSISLPPGTEALVVVTAPGRARFTRWVTFDESGPLRVALPPGARLVGTVVDDRGTPIPGAEVRVDREGEGLLPWTATTDGAGSFDIDTLHAGEHAVRVHAEGHGTVVRSGVEPDGQRLRITMDRVGSIAGRVIREDGTPEAEATVVIAGSGIWPARSTQADAEGRFRIPGVPPGTYEARAHSGSLVAEPRRGIEVEPDTRAFFTFTLRPGAVLTGIIRDSDTDRGIEGAEITVSAESLDVAPRATTSDAEGHFRIAGIPFGPQRVSVYAEGYVPVTALEHDPAGPLEIELTPGGTLVGVVLDADRQPIEGATLEVVGEAVDHQPVELGGDRGFRDAVFASQLDPGGGMRLEVTEGEVPPIPLVPVSTEERGLSLPTAPTERQWATSHLSDAQGGFRIEGIPPGHVQVVARHPGFASATTARLFVGAGSTWDRLELVLAPAGRLIGRVVDEREVGVEGVLVEVHSDREPHPRVAFTNDRGGFVLDSVVGELSVTARPNGRPAVRERVTVESGGEATVVLALEGELNRLHGRTVDGRGFPVGGVQVAVIALRASAPYRTTLFSARDGTFVADGLPAGPWRLEATSSGYAPSTLDVFETTGEAQIALARGARVEGSVVDDFTGRGVRAVITLVRDDLPPERLRAQTDGDGRFEIPRARAAAWRLTIQADGYLPHERALTVEDRGRGPEDVSLDAIRLVPGGRVEGTVVDALGHVVARATVVAGDGIARTDARGRFSVTGVAAGQVAVVASHPAGGTSDAEDVRVLAGRETLGVVLHLPERLDPTRAAALEGSRRGVALEVAWAQGAARVRSVIPDSHADRAGLRPGDVLVAIDEVEPTSAAEAERLLRGAPNVGAVVEVRRGDRHATLHVQREVWLP